MRRPTLLSALVLIVLLGRCSDGGGRYEETFTNGGMSLTASATSNSTNKTVTVTDASDTEILTLDVSRTGATLSAPGESDISMRFYSALEELPTDYAASRMAIYVAGIRALNSSASAMPDSPGCDWFPDTQCTLDCCAQHDKCYRENNCGASSWLWGFGTDACEHCNAIAYDCIAAACVGVTDSFLPNNCYDARCDLYYDCPPDYDSCTCKDICADSGRTIAPTCGDGQCATGENKTNCWNDCAFGRPAEEPATTCQGDGPWAPIGNGCGIPFPPTIETPDGVWDMCSGPYAQTGCEDLAEEHYWVWKAGGDTSFPNGYINGGVTYFGPPWTECEEGTPGWAACTNEWELHLTVEWFDRGRDEPQGDYAEWRALVESRHQMQDRCDTFACTEASVFSPTHWVALEYRVPTRWDPAWIEARVQELFTDLEPHAWPR